MMGARQSLFILSVLLVLSWITGCSNSHTIKTYEEISLKENATIILKTFEQVQVTNTIILRDSVHAIRFPSREEFHSQASEINRIIVSRDHRLAYGLAGAASGAIWVILTQDEWNDDNNTGYVYYWSAVYGSIGGYLGYKLGTFHPLEYTYYFSSNDTHKKLEDTP